jgi:hypothetical protein
LDSDDFTAIAHEGLAFMNPLAEEDVEEMIEALELEPGAHVLDLGCGKAEILLRIVERYPDVRMPCSASCSWTPSFRPRASS